MRTIIASALLCLGWTSPALATPDVRPATTELVLRLPAAQGPSLQIVERTAAVAPSPRRLGLGLPSLDLLRPLLVELDTFLGPVRLEFLSLDQLQWQGSLVNVLEDATAASSPSTLFDRTELLDRYVVAVPIVWF
jgi:hypothetical protein